MAFKIVRNDITKTETEALHADGMSEEELRACYRKSLNLAKGGSARSVALPLIPAGANGYPREEAVRIAVDEINDFLRKDDMDITLVVSDSTPGKSGKEMYPDLEEYISRHYVRDEVEEVCMMSRPDSSSARRLGKARMMRLPEYDLPCESAAMPLRDEAFGAKGLEPDEDALGEAISERLQHAEDPFGVYLLYLIRQKGMTNAQVYNRAIISKQSFAKLNKNPGTYHPDKITALQYCVGAKLNIDETKDLLARAGYALSPSDKRDIIFSYFITHEIFDIIEIDIMLEEHGIPCIIK